MVFPFLYKHKKALDMALYWLSKKLIKEKDLRGWKVPIFHFCQWLPAQKSNCSSQDVDDLSLNVLKSTFTPVSWKQGPQRRWPEGNYNECKSLPNTQLWPWSASRNKSEGDWVEHHRFILLKPKQ